jgi:hypothetical protein
LESFSVLTKDLHFRFEGKNVNVSSAGRMLGKQTNSNGKELIRALQSLPVLSDDHYLRMQAMNLGVIDNFLVEAERQLLWEYEQIERTPMASATFVSALTQLWIFGVYELLRTWRERVGEVLKFVENLKPATRSEQMKAKEEKLNTTSHKIAGIKDTRWRSFKKATNDANFAKSLQSALDNSERIFRKIEILRVHLAKHEQHKSPGSAAFAPGYARINMETGTMYYQIALPGKSLPGEVDQISRRDIADGCRDFSRDKSRYIIPFALRKQLSKFPEWSYGVKQVKVFLRNGSSFGGVFVYWNVEIVGMRGRSKQPFDARTIIRVENDGDGKPQSASAN